MEEEEEGEEGEEGKERKRKTIMVTSTTTKKDNKITTAQSATPYSINLEYINIRCQWCLCLLRSLASSLASQLPATKFYTGSVCRSRGSLAGLGL